MIELNLLPKELRKKKKREIQIPKIPVVPVVVGIAAVLIFMHIVLALLAMNSRHLLRSLKGKWAQMKPQREKTDGIAGEIADLGKKNSVIRQISERGLNWTNLLSGLNQAVIPNIWLSSFGVRYKDKGKEHPYGDSPDSLYLAGYALGNSEEATSRTAKFINSLKGVGDFSEFFETLELKNIVNKKIAGEEVMMFELDCRFKKSGQVQEKPPDKTKKNG